MPKIDSSKTDPTKYDGVPYFATPDWSTEWCREFCAPHIHLLLIVLKKQNHWRVIANKAKGSSPSKVGVLDSWQRQMILTYTELRDYGVDLRNISRTVQRINASGLARVDYRRGRDCTLTITLNTRVTARNEDDSYDPNA